MSWVFIVLLIVASLIKVLAASAPSGVVEKVGKRFQLHPTLSHDVTVKQDGKALSEDKQRSLIDEFNQANFLEKYYYAPEPQGTPFEIEVKTDRYLIYPYPDRVDVFKYTKKKMFSYSLRSQTLQSQAAH
ncbi:YfmQ family protein [Terribacillus saccharophilus]|uniref:YfmQ family protein n=1 Tax=Terribacillus saccharophilus TaxID=361277 RepID=UPI0039827BF1